MERAPDITRMLNDWTQGDSVAGERLMSLIYDDLRKISAQQLHRASTITLQATELANEAYLRLADQRGNWLNRTQFFAVSSIVIRRVLVDHARARRAQRRDRRLEVGYEEHHAAMSLERAEELLHLEMALQALTMIDERKARVVELRYFGGLNSDEIARILEISPGTVKREWAMAKAWLYRRMSEPSQPNESDHDRP